MTYTKYYQQCENDKYFIWYTPYSRNTYEIWAPFPYSRKKTASLAEAVRDHFPLTGYIVVDGFTRISGPFKTFKEAKMAYLFITGEPL